MRIGYVLAVFPSPTMTFIAREIEALKRRGFEITVFAIKRPAVMLGRSLNSDETLRSCEYARPDNLFRHVMVNLAAMVLHPVRYFSALRVFVREWVRLDPGTFLQLLYHFSWGVAIAEEARRRRIEHLHCHFTSGCDAALAANLYSGIPYSFTAHASGDVFVKPVLLPTKVRCARMIVTVCEYTRKYVDAVTGFADSDKLHRVYNGIDVQESASYSPPAGDTIAPAGASPRVFHLLSVGSLVGVKGHATLIDVCRLLRDEGIPLRCTIVGSGPNRPVLERKIREAGLSDVVELAGLQSIADVYQAMRDSDVFVLLSEIGVNGYRDGFPTVILEAMAMSLPVVSTWISGIPEMVVDQVTGILVPERDPATASAAIARLLRDPALRASMGSAGRERVSSHFSLDGSADQLARLFREALAAPRKDERGKPEALPEARETAETEFAPAARQPGPDGRLVLANLLAYSGAVYLWDRFANRRRSPIVYYHNVHAAGDDISWCGEPSLSMPVALFREQIEYLRRHYSLVSLDEAAVAASPEVLAITFDDGYRGVYRNAFPILREYGIPATVFLNTDVIGSSSVLWWDQLVHRLRGLRRLPAARRAECVHELPEAWAALLAGDAPAAEVLARYKTADAALRSDVDRVLASVVAAPYRHPEPVFLSAAEIAEMRAAGISFGAHTKTHPLLTWLDDDALRDELRGSKEAVEALTGERPCWFAYPDGTFTERERIAVEVLGFAGAVQTFRQPGVEGRFAIPRVGLNEQTTARSDGRLADTKFRRALAGLTRPRVAQLLRGTGGSATPVRVRSVHRAANLAVVASRCVAARPSHSVSLPIPAGGASGADSTIRDGAHLQAAAQWLAFAQDSTCDGGVAGDYSAWRGWSPSYPETTGFLVPTFLRMAKEPGLEPFEERAARAIEFLLRCQLHTGAFPGGRHGHRAPSASVFNSAQIICGLVAWHRHTGDQRVLDAAVRAGDWLVSVQDPDGGWTRDVFLDLATTYTAHASCWLAELGEHIGEDRYREAARRHVGWVLTQVDRETGWIDRCGFTAQDLRRRVGSTHTIAYTVSGLLHTSQLLGIESGAAAAERAAKEIADLTERHGWLPGVLDWRWRRRAGFACVTGTAQMALVWIRLFDGSREPRWLDSARRAIDVVEQAQEMRASSPELHGGIPGSDPVWGGYGRFAYPNWAVKFFVDALFERRRVLGHVAPSQDRPVVSSPLETRSS